MLKGLEKAGLRMIYGQINYLVDNPRHVSFAKFTSIDGMDEGVFLLVDALPESGILHHSVMSYGYG